MSMVTWVRQGETAVNNEKWHAECRQIIEKILMNKPHLSLYSFDVGYTKSSAQLNVRIDSRANKFGSPTIDECEEVAREVKNEVIVLFENNSGPEDFNLEVSSAGAERELYEVDQLERFKELPMKIQYYNEAEKVQTAYAKFISYENEVITWQLVSTKKKKIEKNKQTNLQTNLERLKKVNLYLDF